MFDGLHAKGSPIHGCGLFDNRPIEKGDLIGIFYLCQPKKESPYDIYIGDLKFRVDGILKYANHSDKPNCEVEIIEQYGFEYTLCVMLVAKKNIKANVELTWDYGEDFNGSN